MANSSLMEFYPPGCNEQLLQRKVNSLSVKLCLSLEGQHFVSPVFNELFLDHLI